MSYGRCNLLKCWIFFYCCVFQIAAKIGGDGVAAPQTNEFGYGGQKRPLEDAGGYFPMPNLNTGQWLKSIQCKSC